MTIETLKNALPEYAKDIKLNLSSIVNEDTLTEQQLWGTLLASALAGRNALVIKSIAAEAEEHLSPEAINAAKAAHAIMGMNNIYYRFLSLTSDKEYQTMPANLRMSILANPGIEKGDFEAYELAVSVINACKGCVTAHETGLVKEGFTKKEIQTIVRIASIVHAVSVVLEGETTLGAATTAAQAA